MVMCFVTCEENQKFVIKLSRKPLILFNVKCCSPVPVLCVGPLLYHYSDVPGESSVELSYEDLRSIIKQIGFDFEVKNCHP